MKTMHGLLHGRVVLYEMSWLWLTLSLRMQS